MATIAVIGTLDSKGHEHAFLADRIRERGHTPLFIDTGTLAEPQITPDITRDDILAAVNRTLPEAEDRGQRVAAMAEALPALLTQLHGQNRIHGAISLGGGGGTAIATAGMRALPLGFPKLMVTTLASGNTAPYVGTKDIVMFPSIVDVAGLNRLSQTIFTRAAGAVCGMVDAVPDTAREKPLIVASMFGNTTDCVATARNLLEQKNYEVLVFHATGTGGRTMESLIESDLVTGVLDITTTEWADELVGGILSAGPKRLDAAAKAGLPTIITPGCLDMVNFGEPDTVPEKFKDRTFYHHNPQVTLMRTTPQEGATLGKILAEKANASTGPIAVLLPLKAISVISAKGQPFHDPEADQALFDNIRSHLKPSVLLKEIDAEINESSFAEACVQTWLELANPKESP